MNQNFSWRHRQRVIQAIFLVVFAIIFGRLFQLQIIDHEKYSNLALEEHTKKFEIKASRGIIKLSDGKTQVPFVLNENRPTLYADPRYVKEPEKVAAAISGVTKQDVTELIDKLKEKRSYVVLAKKLTKEQADALTKLKTDGQIKGVGMQDFQARVYPHGPLGAQVLGFVNAEGEGQYGVEGALDAELIGKSGSLKAVTDINGIPLAASNETIEKPAVDGQDINLTLDINVQQQLEDTLREQVTNYKAKSGSAIVVRVNTGEILGIANYPTYNPAEYEKVTDYATFSNPAVADAYEPGSVVKVLTMASGLSTGAVTPSSTFFDTQSTTVDDRVIRNSFNWGSADRTMTEILQKSLNTGAVYILRQMGGGTINTKARETLRNYFVDKFHLGQKTGYDLGGEGTGVIADVNTGAGDNVRYANITFGQGMTATPLQLVAAFSSILNGGNYYTPHILLGVTTAPKESGIVSATVSQQVIDMLQETGKNAKLTRAGYVMGGKSSTAQIPDGQGGYSETATIDSYMGFAGGQNPEFAIIARINEPQSKEGGTITAGPVVKKMADWLLDYYSIPARSD